MLVPLTQLNEDMLLKSATPLKLIKDVLRGQ